MNSQTNTQATTQAISSKQKNILLNAWKWIYDYRYLHLFALPCVLYFVIFKYIPMYGILMAFKNYRGVGGLAGIWTSEWAGLDNFINFFSGIYFWRLFRNTLVISFYRLLFSFPAPIILAILINELKNRYFKRIVQTITYMPYFLSWVVTAGLIITLCSPTSGPINIILKSLFGTEPVFFVSDTRFFRGVLIFSDIWKNVGWGTIIYLAAMTGISPELYEAATVDGANKWEIIHITLPSIKEITAIMFILAVGRVLNQNFDQIFNLYNPAVYEVADVFETYVYRAGVIQSQFSYTTAVGLFKSVVSLILVIISDKVAKKLGTEGLW